MNIIPPMQPFENWEQVNLSKVFLSDSVQIFEGGQDVSRKMYELYSLGYNQAIQQVRDIQARLDLAEEYIKAKQHITINIPERPSLWRRLFS